MLKRYGIAALAAVLAVLSCTHREESGIQKVKFQAVQADGPSTKTVLQADGSVFWSPGDAVSLFYGGATIQKTKLTAENTSAAAQTTFSGVLDGFLPDGSTSFWAVYPYAAETAFDGSAVTVTVPADQTAVAGTFASDAFVSIATSKDYTLQFYNLCGGIKFSVANQGITSVIFKGNSDEILAGQVQAAFDENGKPVVTEVMKGTMELVLNAPEGGFEVGKWYYIVALPTTLSAGYTMTFLDAAGGLVAERVTDTSIAIKRAVWGRLTEADDVTVSLPNNEIWYTSTDGAVVSPTTTQGFGADYVSNTYEDGMGVIKFDGPITTIPSSAFRDCATLQSVTHMGTELSSINYGAFSGCSNLSSVELPESLLSIGGMAFHNTVLVEVTIPESVESIGTDSFKQDDVQRTLQAFYGKGASEDHLSLVINGVLVAVARMDDPLDFVIPEGVTKVGWGVFFYANYKTITLPDGLLDCNYGFPSLLQLEAFYGPNTSEDHRCVIIDGVIKAFASEGLTSYTVTDQLSAIGGHAFYNQNSTLRKLILPDSATSVGTSAFSLTPIDSLVLPAHLKSIDREAFFAMYSLPRLTIPAEVETIGSKAFSYAGNQLGGMSDITFLPTTPPTILEDTFGDLIGDCVFYVPEESLQAYKNAEYWSNYADRIFAIPDGVQPDNEIWYTSTTGEVIDPYDATVFGANLVSNTYDRGKGIITFDGPVTGIGEDAFLWTGNGNAYKLLSISLPETVTTIGSSAFFQCQNLTQVSIPDGVTSIGFGAFLGCYSLPEIHLPTSLNSIGSDAFLGCSELTTVHIPDGVTSIGTGAFASCNNLSSFTGKYVSADGRCLIVNNSLYAFAPSGLTTYTVPDGVVEIMNETFRGHNGLEEVVFPEGLLRMGGAFTFCDGLKRVTIPSTVSDIYSVLIDKCTIEEGLYVMPVTPPTAPTVVPLFRDSNEFPIYVPAASLDDYKAAAGWSDFADRIHPIDGESPITASKYLTFTSEGTTTVSMRNEGNNAPMLYYSTDAQTWTQWDYSGLQFTSNAPLYLCGNNSDGFSTSSSDYSMFTSEGDSFAVSGDIMSLISYSTDVLDIPCPYCFFMLFGGNSILTSGPELPATGLTESCYSSMYASCINLASAPVFPAATTLAQFCYQNMFFRCSNLVEAPALPFTTLAEYCYHSMFYYSGLKEAPVLPATVLVTGCYINMFYGCTELASVKCLATDISAMNGTLEWLNSVSSTGVFIKDANTQWPSGTSGIPEGWTVQDAEASDLDGRWEALRDNDDPTSVAMVALFAGNNLDLYIIAWGQHYVGTYQYADGAITYTISEAYQAYTDVTATSHSWEAGNLDASTLALSDGYDWYEMDPDTLANYKEDLQEFSFLLQDGNNSATSALFGLDIVFTKVN